jgi:putative transmembrane protein PGPGW
VSASDDPPRHHLIDRLHARRAHHQRRPLPIRVLYVVAGATLFLAGVAMLVLPGPAFIVLPLGLFLLALEFAWAEAALVASLRQAEKARVKAAETTALQRLLTAAATLLAAAAFAAWAIYGDVPVLPV